MSESRQQYKVRAQREAETTAPDCASCDMYVAQIEAIDHAFQQAETHVGLNGKLFDWSEEDTKIHNDQVDAWFARVLSHLRQIHGKEVA